MDYGHLRHHEVITKICIEKEVRRTHMHTHIYTHANFFESKKNGFLQLIRQRASGDNHKGLF